MRLHFNSGPFHIAVAVVLSLLGLFARVLIRNFVVIMN